MVKNLTLMKVSPEFRDLFKQYSTETGLSIADLTRLAVRQHNNGNIKMVFNIKKSKRQNKLMLNEPMFEMFK